MPCLVKTQSLLRGLGQAATVSLQQSLRCQLSGPVLPQPHRGQCCPGGIAGDPVAQAGGGTHCLTAARLPLGTGPWKRLGNVVLLWFSVLGEVPATQCGGGVWAGTWLLLRLL